MIQKEESGNYPYFGNTKGKNTWSECTNMVQIGWNRYDSVSYISEFLSLNSEWLFSLKEKFETLENKEEVIKYLITDSKGNFLMEEINNYRLKKMIVDFEQEVYRTNVREFNSELPVDVYMFLKSENYEIMTNMISDRFPNCKITDINLNVEIKMLSNKRNENLKKMFYYLDNEWDGSMISVNDLKVKFDISHKKWTEQFTGKDSKGASLFKNRGIEVIKGDMGTSDKYYIIKI